MTDLEMTKLCAEAMGIELFDYGGTEIEHQWRIDDTMAYWPLAYDGQAMALLKRFPNECIAALERWIEDAPWFDGYRTWMFADGVNRAIVECVAATEVSVRSQDNA